MGTTTTLGAAAAPQTPAMPARNLSPAASYQQQENADRYGFTFLSVYIAVIMLLACIAAWPTTTGIIAAMHLTGDQVQIGIVRACIFFVALFVFMALGWFLVKLFENTARIAQSLEKLSGMQ